MVTLNEQIDIKAPYERMEAWVDHFQEEFVKWSPYHTGMRVRFREIVGVLDYNVTGTITECEQDKDHFHIVFQSDKKTSFITFEGKRTEEGCHFSHTESFGLTKPVIGPILEFLTFKVFYRKWCNWKLIRDDMVLDNQYLNDILTEGRYPERIPEIEALSNARRK